MRRIIAALLVACLALVSVACGGEQRDVDIAALAGELCREVAFESELTELAEGQLENYFTVPAGTQSAAYMSNGTTAEEVIAAKCASESDARALKESIERFLDDQRTEMERYLPEEAARLEHAILAQKGVYVVLCVTADTSAAESIIKERLG
ncbi:MAG: DUF4358 domain-containing protein [Oscillospiraceae bacterium]|nr:DUF4358 domain-containing protein [Oscillospiraceae bacterium]